MSTDLGEFEGHPITGMSIVLKMPGGPLNPAVAVHARNIAKGDVVDFLVRTVAGGVAFDDDKDDDDAYTRKQMMKVRTITIVDAEFAAERIAAQEEANDRAKGLVKIPFGAPLDKGAVIHTDASGVVLTDAEYADLIEADVPVFETTPILAEYDNDDDTGNRLLWPDMFDKGAPRPFVGQPAGKGTVTALIDHTTGLVVAGRGYANGDPVAGDDLPLSSATLEPDPALVEWLTGSVADVKARVAAQLSSTYLDAALAIELDGPNRPRQLIVNAIKARLADLEGS